MKACAYWSDLTIGDCWSKAVQYPGKGEIEGVSIAIPHTEQGVRIMEELGDCFKCSESAENLLQSNPSYFHPVKQNIYREKVLQEIRRKGTEKVLYKYCGNAFGAKVRKKLSVYYKTR